MTVTLGLSEVLRDRLYLETDDLNSSLSRVRSLQQFEFKTRQTFDFSQHNFDFPMYLGQ